MSDKTYPTIRDLDGVFFRVKRGDEYKPICFSDMTHEERLEVMEGRPAEWLMSLADIMAETLHEIGDAFSIVGSVQDEDGDEDGDD